MLVVIALILLVAWVLGLTLRIAGAFIHIALILAILSFIGHFITAKARRLPQ